MCVALVVSAGLTGCRVGDKLIGEMPRVEQQQQQPLKDQLRNAESVDKPVYWLGMRFRDAELRTAVVSRSKQAAGFKYTFEPRDPRACSGVCGSDYSVSTSSNRRVILNDYRRELAKRGCVRVIQSQIVIGCKEDESWLVLRGRRVVQIGDDYRYLNEARGRKMVVKLRAFGKSARDDERATAPLTADELQGLSPRAVAALRKAFSQVR